MQAITNGTNYTLDVELLESLRRQCARRAPGHSPAHVQVPGMKANLSVSLSSLKTDDATLSGAEARCRVEPYFELRAQVS